jgi:hypothetical protein
MKLNDLKNKSFKTAEYCPFEQFAGKLEKIKKQLVFEEEYRKIKEREQRYLDKKKIEEQKRKESANGKE